VAPVDLAGPPAPAAHIVVPADGGLCR
jgi:hypothetical protein